ncbi:MAG: DNA helicase II [Syntrophorhabdus sp. PtaB.Bin047]|nr:MAG: DNA helicase II [Syntrophorhabdus sp. PtaB.Bin047]
MADGDLREELNERQYEAVTAVDGPVLVIAGAGSGKTRVIEYRVRYLVETGIDPASILLLTFTRRSAKEMISRAARHDPRCEGVEGGTFHSFANKMLRRYSAFFGLPDTFTIYDESDAEEAIHRSATGLGFYERQKRRPRKDMLRKILSMAVNKEMPLEGVLERHYPEFLQFADEIGELRRKYAEYKVASQCLDYDDLLLYFKLLLENEDMRSRIAARYRYVMIDEFQDTNAMQGDIAYHLAAAHRNILAVGDDAQSIYSFRGSSHENIMRFPERFDGCRVIKLEDNYRSTQAILNVGNAVLDNMANKYQKCLKAVAKDYGEKPRLIYSRDAHEEAAWVVDRIKEFYDQGMELSHQCVLFRSSYITIPLQAELGRRNIPFAVYGGLKFYETAHVKDLIAHLKLFVNPKDELAWSRVLLLVPGIGPKTAERMLGEMVSCETLRSVVANVIEPTGTVLGRSSAGLARLARLLESDGTGPEDVVRRVIDYCDPILREKFDLDWNLRKNDLDALAQISGRYESVRDFLVDLAIEPPERGVKDFHDTIWERPLILSTIHSAKGLEWRNVFLIGAVDGVLPSSYTTRDDEGLEEERRLLYVAVTRARERLYVLAHHEGRNNGIHTFNRLSRFIEAPNVRACLDEGHLLDAPETDETAIHGPRDGMSKTDLLEKLLDSMK